METSLITLLPALAHASTASAPAQCGYTRHEISNHDEYLLLSTKHMCYDIHDYCYDLLRYHLRYDLTFQFCYLLATAYDTRLLLRCTLRHVRTTFATIYAYDFTLPCRYKTGRICSELATRPKVRKGRRNVVGYCMMDCVLNASARSEQYGI